MSYLEKEVIKIKTEIKITYPEAKRIVNIYNVPIPNIPFYASDLKVTTKDSSTQAGESQIFSPTSVNTPVNSSSTDNRSTLSGPADSSGVSASKHAASTITL